MPPTQRQVPGNTRILTGTTQGIRAGKGAQSLETQSEGMSMDWDLDTEVADQFAAQFRPSWAPLDGAHEVHVQAPRASIPVHAEPRRSSRPAAPVELRTRASTFSQDDPIAVPGRNTKRRAAALATLSITSFLAMAYWAVSTTSKSPQQTQLNAALRSAGSSHIQPTEAIPTPDPRQAAAAVVQAKPAAPTTAAAEAAPIAAATIAPAAESAPPTAAATPAAQADVPTQAEQPELAVAASARQPEAVPEKTVAAAIDAPKTEAPAQAPQPLAAAATPPVSAAHAAVTNGQPDTRPNTHKETVAQHARNPLLVVRALPEGSVHLWLDGQRMANPFDVRLPRDSKHRIDARGEGYETSGQTVRLEADAKLTFSLRRAAVVPAPRAATKAPAARDEPAKAGDKPHRGAGFVSVSPY